MEDQYYINLKKISIEAKLAELKVKRLLPSRQILKENPDKRFKIIKGHGIKNLEELFNELSSKKKLSRFSAKTEIAQEYLTVLKRELMMYRPKPIKLSLVPGVDKNIINKLLSVGIKDTRQLFDEVKTLAARKKFAERLNY